MKDTYLHDKVQESCGELGTLRPHQVGSVSWPTSNVSGVLSQAVLSCFPIFLEAERSHNTLTHLPLLLLPLISWYLWMLILLKPFHSQVFLTSSNRMGPQQSTRGEKETSKIEERNVNVFSASDT